MRRKVIADGAEMLSRRPRTTFALKGILDAVVARGVNQTTSRDFMNTNKPTNHGEAPAFPFQHTDEGVEMENGLTTREYFAGLIMQAIVSRSAFNQDAEDMMKKAGITGAPKVEAFMAHMSVSLSDALIAALNREQP